MNELIYDILNTPFSRYKKTLTILFTESRNKTINKGHTNSIQNITCTSMVRGTRNNWFYCLPYGTNKEEFQNWLNILNTIFPFELEILPEGSGTDIFGRCIHYRNEKDLNTFIQFSQFDLNTGEIISFLYKNKKYCSDTMFWEHYIHLNGYINEIKAINKVYTLETLETAIRDSKIIDKYLDSRNSITFLSDNASPRINVTAETKPLLYDYYLKLLLNNINIFNAYKDFQNNKERLVLRAMYSKSNDKISTYLCHHMIRMGLCPELSIFKRQYETFMQLKPELYFWDAILLTQMGMQMYYYWWLTGKRFFKLPGKQFFEDYARRCDTTSANTFFDKFAFEYDAATKLKIQEAYSINTIDELLALVSRKSQFLKLVPAKKDRFINLKLKDKYTIDSIVDDYFMVKGDDEIVRRYKKTNFIIEEI